MLNSCLNRSNVQSGPPVLGSGAMVEVVEMAGGLLVGIKKRTNANYHGRGDQLYY